MSPNSLTERIPDSVLAFRGYNTTNLGRTGELLSHPMFGPVMERHLATAAQAASDILHRYVDLVAQVRAAQELTLAAYAESLAFILSVELAQLAILRDHFQIDWKRARFAYGFSLGEIGAAIAGGVLDL